MIRCKKIYKSFCSIVLLFYCVINSIIILKLHMKRTSLEKELEQKFNSHSVADTSTKPNWQILSQQELYYTYNWMFNNRVYQYSSNLLVKDGQPIRVESMILSKGEFKESSVKKDFRCIIKSISSGVEKDLQVTKVFIFVSNAKRVKCDIKRDLKLKYNDIAVAIINLSDYNINSNNLTDKDLGSLFFKLPRNMLHFQIPRIVFVPKKKIQEVAHCVHYSYNIAEQDIEKIDNWLNVHKNIGIRKIVFYNANVHKLLEETIYKKYNNTFVEIRPYQIHFEAICNLTRLNYYKQKNVITYQAMKDQCEDAFYNVFNNPIHSAKNRWNHQKITSNDCYSSLENVYEFVSYYDFDEIIYPRIFKIDNNQFNLSEKNCGTESLCSISVKFNKELSMYSYLKKLALNNIDSLKKLGSLYFLNGFYLEPSYYINKLMKDLNDAMIYNQTYFEQASNSFKSKTTLKVHLNLKHKYGHYFTILPQDLSYIKQLYNNYFKMKCFFDNFNELLDQNFDSSFKRFIFLATNNKHQMGKSVHYTDNTDAVFTHYSTISKPGSKILYLKINEGVLSHFRNDLFHLARQLNSSITNLKLDVEYYMHLVSNHSNICLNKRNKHS